jgi:FAD/FMN-containing dehydrogenase
MKTCFEHAQSVVPYGGLTNLVQGCATTPDDIALSFEKMNAIEDIDTTAHTMTVQAGVTMLAAQEAADAEDLFFPVDIGARGTCMLGGNVSSNAGGTKVIRYGMMRDSVLGLEAVLADGTVVSSMNRFIKNNSGFDLKHLFIGTEGVLGLVTRIVFRLGVKPQTHNVALVACDDYARVVAVLNKAKALLGRQTSLTVRGEVSFVCNRGGDGQPSGSGRREFRRRFGRDDRERADFRWRHCQVGQGARGNMGHSRRGRVARQGLL